jgi:hypothetical protein
VAHGCASGRLTLPLRGTDQDIDGGLDPPGTSGGRRQAVPDPQGTEAAELIARLQIPLASIAEGTCGHEHVEPQYRPSRGLRHLVQARSPWCTAGGCGNHATACDVDHTIPWHKNGITCECNLSPLCRHHHRVKQLEGWHLQQPEPGVLVWHTPAGRTYTTTPGTY